jgi:hypothetical protein
LEQNGSCQKSGDAFERMDLGTNFAASEKKTANRLYRFFAKIANQRHVITRVTESDLQKSRCSATEVDQGPHRGPRAWNFPKRVHDEDKILSAPIPAYY